MTRKIGRGSSVYYLHLLLREFHSSGEDWFMSLEPLKHSNLNGANVQFFMVSNHRGRKFIVLKGGD